jgi:ABC-type multidrug transport system ATPase subunit
VGRLSAGQRRRTSLACLLSRRPELWLLDEPHAGLDHETRDQLDALVGQAVAQGATVLLASHELDRAESLAHRVVELVGGTTSSPASGVTHPSRPEPTTPGRPEVTHVA